MGVHVTNKICKKCNLPNDTLWWVEQNNTWVCYPCGDGRRDEQVKLDKKFKQQIINAKRDLI